MHIEHNLQHDFLGCVCVGVCGWVWVGGYTWKSYAWSSYRARGGGLSMECSGISIYMYTCTYMYCYILSFHFTSITLSAVVTSPVPWTRPS